MEIIYICLCFVLRITFDLSLFKLSSCTRLGVRETMASSSVPPATVPAPTAASGTGFGFASKTKKKHFVQQKVKVFRAADPLRGVFLWGVAHSINELSQVPPPVMLLPDDF